MLIFGKGNFGSNVYNVIMKLWKKAAKFVDLEVDTIVVKLKAK
jgi:hypothetical protein